MRPLAEHLIPDEINSSVEGRNDLEMHRQLSVTGAEWGRKFLLFNRLVSAWKPCGIFRSVVRRETKMNSVELTFYTEDQSALTMSLAKYGNVHFIGTRGSPTKVLTGQNLVEKDGERVQKLATKLKCTLFEARAIVGFVLLKQAVKELLGEALFSAEEIEKIKRSEIGVFSVGYASYLDLGKNRDRKLHFMAYVAVSSISMEGYSVPLTTFLGAISARTWKMTDEGGEGWVGRNTGVMIQKKVNNSVYCQQTVYLKAEEVEAKKAGSGEKNHEIMMGLTPVRRQELEEKVRVDTVFYRGAIQTWLKTKTGNAPKQVLLRDAASLFEDKEFVAKMIRFTTAELGWRALLTAPTVEQINRMMEESSDASYIKKWWDKPCSMVRSSAGMRLHFENDMDSKVVERVYKKHNIDLGLPRQFYVFLDDVRLQFLLSSHKREALSHLLIGHAGRGSMAKEVPGILKKAQKQLKTFPRAFNTLNLPNQKTVKTFLKET